MKFSLRRIRINQGGYDDSGHYWGVGQPLFRYEAELPPKLVHASSHPDHEAVRAITNPNKCAECGWDVFNRRVDISDEIRADNREHAKALIVAKYPGATFYK